MILALAALALLAPQAPASSIAVVGTARVRVVQGPKKEPVAGAEVRGFLSPEVVWILWWDSFHSKLEPALQKTIPLGSTDEHGEIVVPTGGKGVLVEASSGNLWGVTWFYTEGEESLPTGSAHEIELRRDFDLRVRVVDAHDQPLTGVAVAHRVDYEWGGSRSRYDNLGRMTDASGVALLRHVGYEMSPVGSAIEARDLIAIATCVQPAVEVLVDPAHPPTEPIVLRMPPTGEVEVTFEEADGTPIRIEGGCALASAREGAESRAYPPFPFLTRNADMEYVDSPGTSSVVFHHVSLDADWDLWVQRNAISKAAHARLRGPHAEGERVRAIVHPPEVVLLEGQFVDEQGAARGVVEFAVQTRWMPPPTGWPRPHFEGNVVFSGPPFSPYDPIEDGLGSLFGLGGGPAIQTDDHSRFRIDFDPERRAVGELLLTFVENRGESGERSLCVRCDKREHGILDLGQLVLPPAPLIASGTIRDEAGQPLAGVMVEGSSSNRGGYRFSTRSLADGTFSLRGACFEKYTDLRFTHANYTDSMKVGVVEMGTRDLAVVMRPNEAGKK